MGSARTGSNPVAVVFRRLAARVGPMNRTFFGRRAARLAQLAERKTLNLVVVGSSPTVGVLFLTPRKKVWQNSGIGTVFSMHYSRTNGSV